MVNDTIALIERGRRHRDGTDRSVLTDTAAVFGKMASIYRDLDAKLAETPLTVEERELVVGLVVRYIVEDEAGTREFLNRAPRHRAIRRRWLR
jgi:succinyl-CoA synthetase beta subunit